jgi:hypothetical protein
MDINSTPSAVALTQVLDVPELLENILSFLPEREILTSVQRVSQTWRAAILDSPRIQRKLFSPKGNKPAALPAWFSTIEGPFTDTPRFDIPMYKGPMTTNDFFKKETRRDGTKEVDGLYLYKGCDLILIDWLESSQEALERKDSYMHYSCYKLPAPQAFGGKPQPVTWDSPGLSWRSLQLCDPPIAVANLHVQELVPDPVELCATIFDRDGGITMGLVHDTVAVMLRSHFRKDAFEVNWVLHVNFGIEGCDKVKGTDKTDENGGESGGERSGENLSEQDDAEAHDAEAHDAEAHKVEENDDGDESEDDSVYQEDFVENMDWEYDGEAVGL